MSGYVRWGSAQESWATPGRSSTSRMTLAWTARPCRPGRSMFQLLGADPIAHW